MEIFVRVAEQGGFSAVARDLRLSPTMVGKHVRFLEDRLGTRLLNRTTRRQSLTEAGHLYLDRCRRLLADVAEADAGVQSMRQTPRGTLRITSPVTFGSQRLAPALAEYLAQHREVRIDLTLSDQPPDLIEEGFEAAIRIGKLADSSLIARPLRPYRTLICASPEYLDRCGTPRKPVDLSQHNCLGFAHWERRDAWRMIGPKGAETVRISGNLSVNHGAALRSAALAGIGVVMQPEALLADDVAAGRLVPLLPHYAPPSRPMQLVYLADKRVPAKLASFIEFIVKNFA